MWAVERLKMCAFMGSFLGGKVLKGMSHDTVEWCKVWKTIDSWFRKWHEEFGEF